MNPSTIGGINKLSEDEKRAIYARYIPRELIERFNLPDLTNDRGLLQFRFAAGSSDVEMMVYHQNDFPDPILYAHLADTMNGQIHVLLYILNDPNSPRFDVDKMPDGRRTQFGIRIRNLEAEKAALLAGLSPGQIRRGLKALRNAMGTFEEFISSLGHDMYYIEPLYYHNAIIFERYGFAYQLGRRLMNKIQAGFGVVKRVGLSGIGAHANDCSKRRQPWQCVELGHYFLYATRFFAERLRRNSKPIPGRNMRIAQLTISFLVLRFCSVPPAPERDGDLCSKPYRPPP